MKITLSMYDIYRLAMGLTMMLDEKQQERGVKPGPEDMDMILLNDLLSLVYDASEGEFVVIETCPSIRRKAKPRRGKVGRPHRRSKYKK